MSVINTICTYTGKLIDLENIKAEDICIRDIAHALSNLCRYTGHVSTFYSVAEHCVLLSRAENMPGTPSARLLHDAVEAYIGDVARPLKNLLPDYRKLEDMIQKVISEKYGVDFDPVKPGDTAMLVVEAHTLMPSEFFGDFKIYDESLLDGSITPYGWDPLTAEQHFIDQAITLGLCRRNIGAQND